MTAPTCDIFCRVIDNHGDIGVCWRLARQLHNEHGWQVRLWLDDPAALPALAPDTCGIKVCPWPADFPAATPAGIVIEAFACELPESYLAAMAQAVQKPVWINLEYLCVESWGPGFHCQPSPHPRLPLVKHFFVPGIRPGTGGLLCEADLLAQRAAWQKASSEAVQVFLFCYENPALPRLLDTWADSPQPIHCRVTPGLPATQVAAWLGEDFAPGSKCQRGSLTLTALPFVAQREFDALLWDSDLNFVRGEDSFARAQWAALPLIWQIYVQAEAAHQVKLSAFLDNYAAALPAPARQALLDFSATWNHPTAPARAELASQWQALAAALPTLQMHAKGWQEHLISLRNLAENLAHFVKTLKTRPD